METASLLDAVRKLFARYVALPADRYLDIVALWVLHTHAIAAADTTPRLVFRSPEKESGKTRALEVLDLVARKTRFTMNATPAAIFRRLKDEPITLLFDEVDAIFNPRAGNHEDLRALLNSGYRRGATVDRVVGEGARMHVEEFPVYAATALAAIGTLPDTIESRAVVVPMRRRAPDEAVQPFRRRRVEEEAEGLQTLLADWAAQAEEQLVAADPVMPEGVTDRSADCWEPLLAIADLAGEPWASRARSAAATIAAGRVAEDGSVGVRLLSDIRSVMDDRTSSASLLDKLNRLEESEWGGWHGGSGMTARDLARKLKPFGIRPKQLRLGDRAGISGYERGGFLDAWTRYLGPGPGAALRPLQGLHDLDRVEDVEPVEPGERARKACPDGHVCGHAPNGSVFCCGDPVRLGEQLA